MRSLYRRARWRIRKRRRLVLAAGAIALVAIAVYVLWPGPNLRVGSEKLADGPLAVAVRAPRSYHIVYRVSSWAGDELVVSTDDVWVSRPFEARVETKRGAPPGGRRTSLTINAFGRVRLGGAILAVPPAPAPQDRRSDALVDEGARGRYLEARERRRVAGRRCRIYRMGGDPAASSLAPVDKAGDTYTDVCIDEAGLVLEEFAIVDGKPLSRRAAVKVSENPEVDENLFAIGDPSLDVRQGGGSVREMVADSRPPGTFWEPSLRSKSLEGFRHRGRYAVIPPQAGFEDPTQRQNLIAFTSDVYVHGVDVVVIEQGATVGTTEPFADDPNARRVTIGELGRGESLYNFGTPLVRVRLDGGRFVRVFGTVPSSRLLAVASSLEEKEGGKLVFVDEARS